MRFAALDFETANSNRHTACALGLTVSNETEAIAETYRLVRPPERRFQFTYIHGIRWEDVSSEKTFDAAWRDVTPYLAGVRFIAAHNAAFDRSVLRACARYYGMSAPRLPFLCTVNLAREVWNIYPTRLPDVCRRLSIDLVHHDAASDARACAAIVRHALRDGGVEAVLRRVG